MRFAIAFLSNLNKNLKIDPHHVEITDLKDLKKIQQIFRREIDPSGVNTSMRGFILKD